MTQIHLNNYQAAAVKTAIYPDRGSIQGLIYTALKLNGEAGEIAELVGKALRDEHGIISEERRVKLKMELGDVLWYIANAAWELNYTLSEIADANIDKLKSRADRGVLKGSGSDR